MSAIRCLHTADLHLDARFPSLGENDVQRRADYLKTFERLITLAIKNEVQLFLIAGDLFDSPTPTASVVAQVQAALKRLCDRGIVPVIIPGTHDALATREAVFVREPFPGILLTEPEASSPVRIEVGGMPVYLYGFAYRNGTTAELLSGMLRRPETGFHIGLLHGSRIGSPEWNYRAKDLPFDLEQIKAMQLDYVALGHYHAFEIFKDDSGRTIACYPGSPEGKKFGENGPRYCALVTLRDDGPVEVQPLAVQTRLLEEREVDLSGITTIEAAVEAITALADPDLLLRLRLTGTIECPLRTDLLAQRCRSRFFALELVDQTRFYDSDYVRRIENEETVRGLFVQRARKLLSEAQPERRPVIEDAFREVLARFGAFGERSE